VNNASNKKHIKGILKPRRKLIALNASAACRSDNVVAKATIRKSIALNAIVKATALNAIVKATIRKSIFQSRYADNELLTLRRTIRQYGLFKILKLPLLNYID